MRLTSSKIDSAQTISLITAAACIVLGIIYSIMTLDLKKAAVGMPNAPKVFPLSLGILIIILGIILMIQQIVKIKQSSTGQNVLEPAPGGDKKKFVLEDHSRQIIFTVLNGIVYALLFPEIGYVLSTIIFLGVELLLFNGKKKWKTVLIVSVIFSLFIYILFSKLLGVYLPRMPFVGF